MCDLCGPWYDDRPTRQELAWDAEQERLDTLVCDKCGERLRYCNCEPEEEEE